MRSHCVNVAVFAVRIAQTLSRDLSCQREVGLASLLHELGVAELPDKLLYKVKSPTREEMKLLRERSARGATILQHLGPEYRWLSRCISSL